MKQHISVIDFDSKKILFADHEKCTDEEIIKTIKQSTTLILKMASPDLRLLINVKDAQISEEVIHHFKESSKIVKPYINRIAVLGVEGVKKIMFITVNKFVGSGAKLFNTKEEALKWLVE